LQDIFIECFWHEKEKKLDYESSHFHFSELRVLDSVDNSLIFRY